LGVYGGFGRQNQPEIGFFREKIPLFFSHSQQGAHWGVEAILPELIQPQFPAPVGQALQGALSETMARGTDR
jgi:hypothetical protein